MKREIIIEIERTTIICSQSAETLSNQNVDFIEVDAIEIPNQPKGISPKTGDRFIEGDKNERKTNKDKG